MIGTKTGCQNSKKKELASSLVAARELQRDVVLSLLTNSALVYVSHCGEFGEGGWRWLRGLSQ